MRPDTLTGHDEGPAARSTPRGVAAAGVLVSPTRSIAFSAALWSALAMMLLAASPAPALEWSLSADRTQAGELRIEQVRVLRSADGGVDAALNGLTVPGLGALGAFRLACPPAALPCREGGLERRRSDGDLAAAARWSRSADATALSGDAGGLALMRTAGGWAVQLEGLDLAAWLSGIEPGVVLQSGHISGDARLESGGGGFDLSIEALAFDTPDGRYAGADLAGSLVVEWGAGRLAGDLVWLDGEALLGPAYLPPPSVPVHVSVGHLAGESGSSETGSSIEARISAEGLLEATIEARASRFSAARMPEQFAVELDVPSLATLWPLGAESIAAGAGWPSLEVEGRLAGSLMWRDGEVRALSLTGAGIGIKDPAGRVSVDGLEAEALRAERQDRIALAFERIQLYSLPFGPAALAISGPPESLSLEGTARIPLLDGALRLDGLRVRSGEGPMPAVELDAALEPVALAELTERLGWPRFGGQLSGRFPGIRIDRETLRVAGGLDIDLFDGSARIEDLAVERPFGPLTALSGTLTLDRLDLAPLTAAFDFGAMQGSLSGHVRGLRLLDWQPVAFDAWFYTPRDSGRPRRISQRAVDQIASLGGGGAAALSAPLLSLFDDFGYAQVGLGCRLAGNVCAMRGLDVVDGGGYRIVEGRGLPRLDVVGFRRQVDWPVLLAQLRAATRGEGPTVGN